MNHRAKISKAFDAFLSGSGPNDKRDAIVIYRVPQDDSFPPARFEATEQRSDYVKLRTTQQQAVRAAVVEAYQKEGPRRLRKKVRLAASSVGSDVLPVSQVEVTRGTLPALAEQHDVVAVLPNQRIYPIQPSRVDLSAAARIDRGPATWGLKELDIPKLWDTTRGAGINVAVLDTGVHGVHPVLSGRVKKFLTVGSSGRALVAHGDQALDMGQHGTHVCGTIAGDKTASGLSIGVAPDATLLAACVLAGNATVATVIQGISWAVEEGAHVVNLSLGFHYYEPHFAVLLDVLIQQYGVLPVVSVGNEGYGRTSSPGNAPNALSVGAIERLPTGATDVAAFSSGASLVSAGPGGSPLVTKPDVVAPGVAVYSSIPPENTRKGTVEYAYMDGTSMAAPHVAGVAALLMATRPRAPVSDIARVLKETAKHPLGGRPDNRWGHGVIEPHDALRALAS